MTNRQLNILLIIYTFLILTVMLFAILIITYKNDEIVKLTKKNEELNQEIIDYKWQIEQVPYIIESWCNGE